MSTAAISDLTQMTVEIVSAYVAKNSLPVSELPVLMRSVHDMLDRIVNGVTASEAKPDKPVPAVSIRRSLTDHYLVCLEDGRQFKSLKRHLRTKFNLTPDAYRAKWGLPPDYPMVAPAYAKARSALALTMGLGRKAAVPTSEPVKPAPVAEPLKPVAKKAKAGARVAETDPALSQSAAKPVRRGRPAKAA